MKKVFIIAFVILTGCSQVHLTSEAREQQCREYGHKEGTPAFGECMQKERQMAQDFWLGDSD